MNSEQLKRQLEHELITSAEAAEMLEISKQRLLTIVKGNGIFPIHQSSQGNLYLRNDIEKLRRGNLEVKRNMPLFINYDSTSEVISKLEEVKNKLGEITHIFVYFDSFDAVLDGFYIVAENSLQNLKELESARFILRDINGNEVWLHNLNCGYLGEGPSGSKTVLEELGVPEELSEFVKDSNYDIVKYFKNEDGEFEVHKHKSNFTRVTESRADLYYTNGKIVCLQNRKHYLNYAKETEKFLHEYLSVVPNPSDIIIFNTKESAIEHGYFGRDFFGREIVYQVILRDTIGRELWLSPEVDNNGPLKYQKSVKQILEYCGLAVDKEKEKTFSQILLDWLTKKPKLVPIEVLELSNKK